MAIKIIDLQAETAPSDDDLLIIRDNATGITRKITRAVLFTAPPIPAGAITNTMIADGAISRAKLGADAKIQVRTDSRISSSSLTPNVDNFEMFTAEALATGMTINAPVGTPVDGQGAMFRFKDNGTAQGLSWNGVYRAMGITIPSATVANKMVYVVVRWNAPAQKWDVLSVGREA